MPESSPAVPDAPRVRSEGQDFSDGDIARFRQRLGSILRQHRRSIEPPVSQKDVSEHLAIAQSAISDWERGETWPSVLSLLLLIRYLDINPAALLEILNDEQPNGEGRAA